MKKNAIFVNSEYYLIPDEFGDFDSFIKMVRQKKSVKLKLKKLEEIKCMAPYFVNEAVKEEMVELDRNSPIFSAEVEVMSKEEYHERLLKAVLEVCPGCGRYTDDGDYSELNGHHEEISLDKVCLIREGKGEEGFYQLYYGLEDFASEFDGEEKAKIEKLIDENNIEAAVTAFKEIIFNYINGVEIVLAHEKKDYVCYFSCLNSDALLLILYYACKFLNGKKIKNWKFVHFLPAGKIKTQKEDLPLVFKDSAKIGIEQSQGIINFCMKDKSFETFKKSYLAVINELGEDKLFAACSHELIWFTADKKGDEVPFETFKKSVLKFKSKESFFADGSPIPAPRRIASFDENGMPNKMANYCSELFFYLFDNVANLYDNTRNDNDWINDFCYMGISAAKLKIKFGSMENAANMLEGISKSIDKILHNDYSFVFAKEIGAGEFSLYFFIAEFGKFLMEVKRHSPVFMDFDTELEFCSENYYKKFKVNFGFECIQKKSFKENKK